MSTIPLYLIKVLLSSGVLYSYYWFFLRNKRFHHYNRFYLLFITLFSWIVPFIEIKILQTNQLVTSSIPNMVYVVANSNSNFEHAIIEKSNFFNWNHIIVSVCLIISVIFIERFFVSFWKVYKLIKKYPIKEIIGLKVILSEAEGTPFSFFDYIFWNTSIDLNSDNGKKILAHEVVHSDELHSLDKIIIEFNIIAGWFNPFFWLIRNELYLIHEFIADSKSIENNDASELAAMLLTVAYPQQHKLFLNPFFFSPIKRRIAMLTNQQKTSFSYFRRVAVLPIAGALVLLLAFKNADKKSNILATNLEQKYTIVIDAGHGGSDAGAIGVNGKTEKDLSLALSARIAALNTNPDIDIVLTRTNDELMNVVDRSNKINALHADLLISLHMNASVKNTGQGIEFVVSNKSSNKDASAKLAAVLDWSSKEVFGKSRGVTTKNKGIWILDQSNCPAVIAELGFITNEKDVQILNEKRDQIANQILGAATLYLKYKGNMEINESKLPSENKSVYTVKWGGNAKDTAIKDLKANVLKSNNTVFVEVTNKTSKRIVGVELDSATKAKSNESMRKALYILNGVKINQDEFAKVDVTNIASVNVLKGESVRTKYGEEGVVNGVIEIKTKNQGTNSLGNASSNNNDNSNAGSSSSISGEPIFTTVEHPAQFPGGNASWIKYLEKNLDRNLLKKNKAPIGSYTVNVHFKVDMDGKVSDVIAENNPGYGSAAEAIRIIENGPNWIPAEQNGKKVNFLARQSIVFVVVN